MAGVTAVGSQSSWSHRTRRPRSALGASLPRTARQSSSTSATFAPAATTRASPITRRAARSRTSDRARSFASSSGPTPAGSPTTSATRATMRRSFRCRRCPDASAVEKVNERHGDRRHVGDEQQEGNEDADEIDVHAGDGPDFRTRDGASGDEDARHRRGLLPDREVQSDDEAEMDGVEPDRARAAGRSARRG